MFSIDLDAPSPKNELKSAAEPKSATLEAVENKSDPSSTPVPASLLTTVASIASSIPSSTTSSIIQKPVPTPAIVHPQLVNMPNLLRPAGGIIYHQPGVPGATYITSNGPGATNLAGANIFQSAQRPLNTNFIASQQNKIMTVNSHFAPPGLVSQPTLATAYTSVQSPQSFLTQQGTILPLGSYQSYARSGFINQTSFGTASPQFTTHQPTPTAVHSISSMQNQPLNLQPTVTTQPQVPVTNQTAVAPSVTLCKTDRDTESPVPEIANSNIKQIASRRWRPSMKQKTKVDEAPSVSF
ncbi:hypothetical protein Ciccas_004356 [Cichlidogyrus casuarinus]|uniref:Uncharacterized protein n=1 Tax=Cichlidogyrus casuarinus TaxID=1844966 RepID=A0ABD2QBV9_9PLAT